MYWVPFSLLLFVHQKTADWWHKSDSHKQHTMGTLSLSPGSIPRVILNTFSLCFNWANQIDKHILHRLPCLNLGGELSPLLIQLSLYLSWMLIWTDVFVQREIKIGNTSSLNGGSHSAGEFRILYLTTNPHVNCGSSGYCVHFLDPFSPYSKYPYRLKVNMPPPYLFSKTQNFWPKTIHSWLRLFCTVENVDLAALYTFIYTIECFYASHL